MSQQAHSRQSNASQEMDIPIQAKLRGPGPAQYMLPGLTGRSSVDHTKRASPAYSFGSRRWSFKSDSPGPAYGYDPSLTPRGKENTPAFSFGSRLRTPKRDVSPGPGAYNTDKKPLKERNSPMYTLSPRTKQRPIDATPSPLAYSLPPTLGASVVAMESSPSPSLFGRNPHGSFQADLAKSPGPARFGAFNPSLTKRQSPSFTLKGRNYMPEPRNTVPGPGTYNSDAVNAHMKSSPKYAIGVKHSDFIMPTLTLADISN